jgi:hypothetical protein
MSDLSNLKLILREGDIPFFTDEQLNFYLEQNGGDVRGAAYQCLLVKAEDTTLSVSGLSTADTSKYFRRLASQYRPFNSGTLKGGY